jgi:peptidoglycan/LPS O-acetylase OafA/YrhL
MAAQRRLDLDIGRGLMMVLLVFRHAVSTEFPRQNDWYVLLYQVSHWFQMPVFMFFSGIVMAVSFRKCNSLPEYARYLKQRFLRLIPAYLLFATIIFAGKMLLQQVVAVENPIKDLDDYLTIFISPRSSPFASYLWFLYVLFAYYMIVSAYLHFISENPLFLLLLSIVLNFVKGPDTMALNLICEYSLYFALGLYVTRFYDNYVHFIDTYFFPLLFLFLAMCAMGVFVELPSYTPIALTALPALHGFSRRGFVLNSKWLQTVGLYMYPIYLINTIPINVIRIVALRFVSWNGMNFLIVLPVLMLSGILIPIAIQKYAISRIPILNKIIY